MPRSWIVTPSAGPRACASCLPATVSEKENHAASWEDLLRCGCFGCSLPLLLPVCVSFLSPGGYYAQDSFEREALNLLGTTGLGALFIAAAGNGASACMPGPAHDTCAQKRPPAP